MKAKIPNYHSKAKQHVRCATIIEPARALFGTLKLPENRQYWTMCAQIGDGATPYLGGELDQLLQEGFITPDQFHGVEMDPNGYGIHDINVASVANMPIKPNLYHNSLESQLLDAAHDGTLRPGVVYVDDIQGPRKSAELLVRVLGALRNTSGPTLLVWNSVMSKRYWRVDWPEYNVILNSTYHYKELIAPWDKYDLGGSNGGWYRGSSEKSDTTMCTVIWCRK